MDPDTTEEWISRLIEMMEEMDTETVVSAYSGNAAAKATVQAWAVEMQAALLFLVTHQAAVQTNVEALMETANTIVDTIQAILIALGIIYLLKRFRKRDRTDAVVEINVTEREFRQDLGDRTRPIPSRPDQDRAKESAFLKLRIDWTTHFLLTLFQGMHIVEELDLEEGEELIWVSRKDAKVCSVCRYMDGKMSENRDFMPVIMKQFPDFNVFVKIMPFPHAHPRCRCIAKPERSEFPTELLTESQRLKDQSTQDDTSVDKRG